MKILKIIQPFTMPIVTTVTMWVSLCVWLVLFNMKQIPLTQGKFALVDDEDYEYLNQFKWYVVCNMDHFYAARKLRIDVNKRSTILMHRVLLGVTDPKIFVDHKDRNTLNYQKCNLRISTPAQNNANRSSKINGTSKYLGVSFYGRDKNWVSKIRQNKKLIHLGYFENELDAAQAYNVAAKEIHGEFANLNIIENV